MSLRHIGAWLLRRWPLVGAVLLLAAVAIALALNLQGARGIFAQAEPTPGAITDDSQFPTAGPFNPQLIPTLVPPPCLSEYEAMRERHSLPHNVRYGAGPNSCSFFDENGRYLTIADV